MLNWPRSDKVITTAFHEAATGSLDDALTLLRRAARKSDPHGDRLEAMGSLLYQRGRWSEAAAAFESALAKRPEDRSRLFYLCSALTRCGDWARADDMLTREGKSSPADAAPAAIRCLLLAEQSLDAEARAAHQSAREIFTRHPHQSHHAMGLLEQCAEALVAQPPAPGAAPAAIP